MWSFLRALRPFSLYQKPLALSKETIFQHAQSRTYSFKQMLDQYKQRSKERMINRVYISSREMEYTQVEDPNPFLLVNMKELEGKDIEKIRCGLDTIFFLSKQGNLFAMGSSNEGALPLHQDLSRPMELIEFQQILKSRIVDLDAGRDHSIFLLEDNRIVVSGSTKGGQSGVGVHGDSTINHPVFPKIPCPSGLIGDSQMQIGDRDKPLDEDDKLIKVVSGYDHLLVLSKKGRVFSWGFGLEGQLGHGTESDQHYPMEVQILDPDSATQERLTFKNVFACTDHSAFLTTDGRLFVCGENTFGEMGLNPLHHPRALYPNRLNGDIADEPIKDVVCGVNYLVVLTESGKVFTLGSSEGDRLSLPPEVIKEYAVTKRRSEFDRNLLDLVPEGDPEYFGLLKMKSDPMLFEPKLVEDLHGYNIERLGGALAHWFVFLSSGRVIMLGDTRSDFQPTQLSGRFQPLDAFTQKKVIDAGSGSMFNIFLTEEVD